MAATHVQSNVYAGYYGGDATPPLAFDSSVVSGNLLCGFIEFPSSLALNSVADNLGNTYNIVNNPTNIGGQDAAMFWIISAYSGACTVTCTLDGDPGWDALVIGISEASGVDTLDTGLTVISGQANPGAGNDAVTSTALTPTVDGCYLFGVSYFADSTAWTKGTGWDSLGDNDGSGPSVATEYFVQSTAASIAATFTITGGGSDTLTGLMVFKPTSDGGTAITKDGALTPSGIPTRHFAGARAVAGAL